jgi:glycosyltransferase involved in cell wall biosynthesis
VSANSGTRAMGLGPKVAYMSSYVPRECGLATFTNDLFTYVEATRSLPRGIVVAMNDEGAPYAYPPEVRIQIDRDNIEHYRQAARLLNDSDVDIVNIQHEHGLFGGRDGEYILAFLREIRKPVVTTLHTVILDPPDHFRAVTRQICEASDVVVVLASCAVPILRDQYRVANPDIRLIHHGAPQTDTRPQFKAAARRALHLSGRRVISTFGLIGPGKGLEYAIEAMRQVVIRHPEAIYLVVGKTHPGVQRQSGEAYRHMLEAMVASYGLENNVRFVNKYLTKGDIQRYLAASDIYFTPYVNRNQIVSGTLAYAAAAGKAIVSTPYLYAEDILRDGRGLLVPFGDVNAMAQALNLLIENDRFRMYLEAKMLAFGRQLIWPTVAVQYVNLFREIMERKLFLTAESITEFGRGVWVG